jgi:hypothetical protein
MNDPEFLKALEMVAEYDRQRTKVVKEYRLYYNEDGTISGLWETDHPLGTNYIVLDDREMFDHNSTLSLRVIDGKLIKLEPQQKKKSRLIKSPGGQAVIKGHAALALADNEQHSNIEHYGIKANN